MSQAQTKRCILLLTAVLLQCGKTQNVCERYRVDPHSFKELVSVHNVFGPKVPRPLSCVAVIVMLMLMVLPRVASPSTRVLVARLGMSSHTDVGITDLNASPPCLALPVAGAYKIARQVDRRPCRLRNLSCKYERSPVHATPFSVSAKCFSSNSFQREPHLGTVNGYNFVHYIAVALLHTTTTATNSSGSRRRHYH